jgi:hypothetical protein
MKIWNALTQDAQDALLVLGFFIECYILFWVMA